MNNFDILVMIDNVNIGLRIEPNKQYVPFPCSHVCRDILVGIWRIELVWAVTAPRVQMNPPRLGPKKKNYIYFFCFDHPKNKNLNPLKKPNNKLIQHEY